MGLIRKLGKGVGTVAGVAVAAPFALAGGIVKSDFLVDVAACVGNATIHTGDLLGNVAEGAVETVYGVATSDKAMQSQGMDKIVDSGAVCVKGIGTGIVRTANQVADTAGAILDGDKDRAIEVGKELIKTAAVATFAITVTDVVGGLDSGALPDVSDFGFDGGDSVDGGGGGIENPNVHYVSPHWRTLSDGRTIWVDGDGDSSVDTFDGWVQSNPNYKL